MDDMLAPPVEETRTSPSFEAIAAWSTEVGTTTSDAAAYANDVPARGGTYVVFITNETGPAEVDFCRHTVVASSLYKAALAAVKECRFNAYGATMIAEVFVHQGDEYRFSYQLHTHNS